MSALVRPSQSDVERAFYDAMVAAGFDPGPIEADTKEFVRFDAPGDKQGRKNGFYKLKTGNYPAGWFGDWKSGEQQGWQYDFGRDLTAKERTQLQQEQRRLKQEAQVAKEAKHREVAERASSMWDKASADVEGHPYLARKRIEIPRGLRLHIATDGTRLLLVPMRAFDHAGNLQLINLQMISPDGDKRFLKGGRVEGTFFHLKGDSSLLVECEGAATGFSIWQATGASVVCAFNSGNLIPVAKEMVRHRPLATLLIAGDDDVIESDTHKELNRQREAEGKAPKQWENAGRKKAEAAATAVGCRWVLPVFTDGPGKNRTDYNDLHMREGEAVVRAQIVGAIQSIEPNDAAPGAELIEPDFIQDESWRTRLPVTSQGSPDGNNVEGVALYIENHKLLRGRLAFNAFTQAVELDGNELADHHVAEFRRIMHADRFKAKKADVADQMLAEARQHTFDPLTAYLQGVKWDGKKRLDTWLRDYCGVVQSVYSATVGRAFLIGAVARALRPGCKMDTMLVLEGDQGTGKSTAYRYLFGDRFFIDHLPDFHSKDAFQQLQGAWCVEVGELAAMTKAEVGDVKLFLSRLVDKFRPPFGRLPISVPRRVVFGGSVNPEEGTGYLRDPTGARRFWPVTTTVIRLDAILLDRDQIWAEAVEAYKAGEPWHLTDEATIAAAQLEQEARREVDPWEIPIRNWLLEGCRDSVTIEATLTNAIQLPIHQQDTRARRRVGAIFKAMKWKSVTERNGMKVNKVYRAPS